MMARIAEKSLTLAALVIIGCLHGMAQTDLKVSSDLRVSFQAKETREGGDPTQAEIGPSLDFYLTPLIRLQDVTKFDLDDSKSRPLVFTVGYRYLPQANNAPATNRMEPVVTFHFPMEGRFLLTDRNRADLGRHGLYRTYYGRNRHRQRTGSPRDPQPQQAQGSARGKGRLRFAALKLD